jgi:hypothetical protein
VKKRKREFASRSSLRSTESRANHSQDEKLKDKTESDGFMLLPSMLSGIEPQFVKLDVSDEKELGKLMRSQPVGAKWFAADFAYVGKVNRGHSETELRKGVDAGKRDVWLIRKPMISRGAYNKMTQLAEARPGTLKASWVKASAGAGVIVKAHQWVLNNTERALGSGASELNGRRKFMLANSRSPGVGSTESIEVIESAIRTRVIKMNIDIDNQLQGVYKRSFRNNN